MSLDEDSSRRSPEKKPKHRPSKTPTGLPGDEPKLRKRRNRQKLGEVVDSLLVPEHKAARRIIRRSQRRHPLMAKSNMTLYERIVAYRQLKQKGSTDSMEGENNGILSEEELKTLERSETGWGSVDISQYTSRKDDDDDERRSPTPQPTLTDDVRAIRKQNRYEPKTTARDVFVEIDDDKLHKKEHLPPVRIATPPKKRTPTPPSSVDKTLVRQSSDLHRHTVLPPITDARQERVNGSERYDERSKVVERERFAVDRREDSTVVAAAAVAASSDRRVEKTVVDDREVERRRLDKDVRSDEYHDDRKYVADDKRVYKEDVRDSRNHDRREDYKKEYRDVREQDRRDDRRDTSRIEKEVRSEVARDIDRRDVKEADRKEDYGKEDSRKYDYRKEEYRKKDDRNGDVRTVEKKREDYYAKNDARNEDRRSVERRDDRRSEETRREENRRDDYRKDEKRYEVKESFDRRDEVRSEDKRREGREDTRDERRTERRDSRGDIVKAAKVKAAEAYDSPQTRSPAPQRRHSPQRRTPSPKPQEAPRQRSQQRSVDTPQRSPSPPPRRQATPPRRVEAVKPRVEIDEPIVERAVSVAARAVSPVARKSPEKRAASRDTPQRRTPLEEEIERLDRMVDRDLNDIIQTIGKKVDNTSKSERDGESKLKQKIFNPSFQSSMDNYLRDI